eukprot:281877-Rhodomonas_salina.3
MRYPTLPSYAYPKRTPVLTLCMLLPLTCDSPATSLRACYAMSGTEIVYLLPGEVVHRRAASSGMLPYQPTRFLRDVRY